MGNLNRKTPKVLPLIFERILFVEPKLSLSEGVGQIVNLSERRLHCHKDGQISNLPCNTRIF